MFYPKITIVTPNYNGSRYLEDTIMSVFGQNYPNLEYIIIDGGSTDGSINIIKKYENRLAYWVSEPDKGMYQAIQKGFDISTGEIMAWINSDDMYHPNSFFTIAEIFNSIKEVNWLVGPCTFYDELGRSIYSFPSRLFTKFDFFNNDFQWIQQESVFWRRSLWEKAGNHLNIDLKYAGDFDLWLRFFQYDRLFVTNSLVGGFRWRQSNQLTIEHMDDYLQEVRETLKKNVLTNYEKKVLFRYQRLLKLDSCLRKLKFINSDWIVKQYRSKYFPKDSRIGFDRKKMKFILAE